MSPHQRPYTLLVVLHILLDRHLHLGQEAVHKGLVFILPLTLPPLPLIKELVKVILNVCFFRLIVLVVLRVVWGCGLRIFKWLAPMLDAVGTNTIADPDQFVQLCLTCQTMVQS